MKAADTHRGRSLGGILRRKFAEGEMNLVEWYNILGELCLASPSNLLGFEKGLSGGCDVLA